MRVLMTRGFPFVGRRTQGGPRRTLLDSIDSGSPLAAAPDSAEESRGGHRPRPRSAAPAPKDSGDVANVAARPRLRHQRRAVRALPSAVLRAVPRVGVHRSLWRLLKHLGPPEHTPGLRRLLCHPRRADDPDGASAPLGEALRAVPAGDRVLLAVGPEGGWDEPDELDSLARHGFERVTLGERTLRTDVAVVSLLAIANEHLEPP